MHTPNNVGNSFYTDNDGTGVNVTGAALYGDLFGWKPYVETAYQSGTFRQSMNCIVNYAAAGVTDFSHTGVAMKMEDLSAEIAEQPYAIEINGCAGIRDLGVDIRPCICWYDSPTYSTKRIISWSNAHLQRLANINQCSDGAGLVTCDFDTKVVIDTNTNKNYEIFVGVSILNLSGGVINDIEGFINISARYDFNCVETYYRGR